MSWSDIPGELLREITKRLDLVDVIRSRAVCSWWGSIPSYKDKYFPKPQIPWLMLTPERKFNSRYFYSLTEERTYGINLPDTAGQHCVGSSHGYLFFVDDNADLIATNPMTGAHLPLPPTSTFPCFDGVRRDSSGRIIEYNLYGICRKTSVIVDWFYSKAILSSDRKIVVVIWMGEHLSFARVGGESWTPLQLPRHCTDIIFHKGHLYATDYWGTIFVDNLDHLSEPTFKSPTGPIKAECAPKRYLVGSPHGDNLFLVLRVYKYVGDNDLARTGSFQVFILDDVVKYKWKQINTLGEYSLFLGLNYSLSLCASEFPGLRKNCIYFTDDYKECYVRNPERAGDNGVFSFDDESVDPLFDDSKLDRLKWPLPVWFMPTIL